eukprot:3621516-Pleurochrysis_carterae.AAC.1
MAARVLAARGAAAGAGPGSPNGDTPAGERRSGGGRREGAGRGAAGGASGEGVEAAPPESLLSELLRQMTAERDARHEARARGTGARALDFDTPAQEGPGVLTLTAGSKRRAGQAEIGDAWGGEAHAGQLMAFEGLRPLGAEAGTAGAVLAALEQSMLRATG